MMMCVFDGYCSGEISEDFDFEIVMVKEVKEMIKVDFFVFDIFSQKYLLDMDMDDVKFVFLFFIDWDIVNDFKVKFDVVKFEVCDGGEVRYCLFFLFVLLD